MEVARLTMKRRAGLRAVTAGCLLAAVAGLTAVLAAPAGAALTEAAADAKKALKAKHGDAETARIERGVEQVWRR